MVREKFDKRDGFLLVTKVMELFKHIFPMRENYTLSEQVVREEYFNKTRLASTLLAKKNHLY